MSATSVEEFKKLVDALINTFENLYSPDCGYAYSIEDAELEFQNTKSAVISAYRAALGDGWHERVKTDDYFEDKPDVIGNQVLFQRHNGEYGVITVDDKVPWDDILRIDINFNWLRWRYLEV